MINIFFQNRLDAIFEGNVVLENRHGIEVALTSDPLIRENLLQGNTNEAIRIFDDCSPTLVDNIYNGNGRDKVRVTVSDLTDVCCVPITIFVAITCLLILSLVHWRGAEKERKLKENP